MQMVNLHVQSSTNAACGMQQIQTMKMVKCNRLIQWVKNGEALIENSYFVVYDMKNPEKVEVKTTKDGQEVITYNWKADACAYVYTIANAKEIINTVVNDMWIYDNDMAEVKEAKKQAYDNLKVEMELVTTIGLTEVGDYLDEALENVYEDLLVHLEKQIEKWQATFDCQTVKPYITANAGKKEGIKNAQRYAIYGQVYDKKTEKSEFKRKGYARATEVADNVTIADGVADTTYFFRISGMTPMKGTEIMKQKNDLRIGIHANFNLLPGLSNIDAGVDYLAFIQKNGISHYALINAGFDLAEEYTNISVGYMIGLKLKILLEIQPYAAYAMDINNAGFASEGDIMDYTADWVKAGARVVLNSFYPFQIFVEGNCALQLTEKDYYGKRDNGGLGIGVGAGVKYCL